MGLREAQARRSKTDIGRAGSRSEVFDARLYRRAHSIVLAAAARRALETGRASKSPVCVWPNRMDPKSIWRDQLIDNSILRV